jgi:hypothetical protein
MTFGAPSITTPGRLDLRAIQASVSNARRRVEILEGAVTALQNTAVNTTSASATVSALQSEVAGLVIALTSLEATLGQDITTFVADEVIAKYHPVFMSGVGHVRPINPHDPNAIYGTIGIATVAAQINGSVTVQRSGVLQVVGAVFTHGYPVFAGVDGLTQRPDYTNVSVPIGVAVGTDSVGLAPGWPTLQYPGVYSEYEGYMPVGFSLVREVLELMNGLLNQPDGIVVKIGANLVTRAIITPSGGGVTVLHGDGVAGDPTISVP